MERGHEKREKSGQVNRALAYVVTGQLANSLLVGLGVTHPSQWTRQPTQLLTMKTDRIKQLTLLLTEAIFTGETFSLALPIHWLDPRLQFFAVFIASARLINVFPPLFLAVCSVE